MRAIDCDAVFWVSTALYGGAGGILDEVRRLCSTYREFSWRNTTMIAWPDLHDAADWLALMAKLNRPSELYANGYGAFACARQADSANAGKLHWLGAAEQPGSWDWATIKVKPRELVRATGDTELWFYITVPLPAGAVELTTIRDERDSLAQLTGADLHALIW